MFRRVPQKTPESNPVKDRVWAWVGRSFAGTVRTPVPRTRFSPRRLDKRQSKEVTHTPEARSGTPLVPPVSLKLFGRNSFVCRMTLVICMLLNFSFFFYVFIMDQ